jgi:Astacin (Peptidase family M12A)
MTARLPTMAMIAAVAVSMVFAGPASAHNPKGGGADLPKVYVKRLIAAQKAMNDLDSSDQAKGIYSTLVQWPPTYPKLRVCFMGGSPEVRAAIAEVANTWIRNDIGIRFDWGKQDKFRDCDPAGGKENQVRVSFDKPGYWSQLGQNSVVYTKQEEPSLNLEGFDKAADVAVLKQGEAEGIILHEFGHALGLLHEHQSPNATCKDEFDWDHINKTLAEPPNSWDQETINFNMQPFSGEDLMMTQFDPSSVMLYYFPPDYYKDGDKSKCFIPSANNEISETDFTTVAYMYPADAAARLKNFENRKVALQGVVQKASASGKKGIMVDLAKLFFGSPGTASIPDGE